MARPAPDLSTTADKLHSLAVRLLRRARVADRDAGVGPAQLSALSVLYFADGLPLTSLAEAEQVAQPTMTRIVNALVGTGLARRFPSPTDGRVQLVEITQPGRSLFEASRQRRLALIEEILAELEPHVVSELLPLVERVLAQVNAHR